MCITQIILLLFLFQQRRICIFRISTVIDILPFHWFKKGICQLLIQKKDICQLMVKAYIGHVHVLFNCLRD